VTGTIYSADSTSRYRVEAKSDSDTTFVRFIERKCPGDYILRVPPGRYRLRAIQFTVAPGLQAPPGARAAAGPPAAEVRREGILDARPEEQYEHVDFRFQGAAPPPKR